MSLSEDLQKSVGPLWEKTVTHPFVIELGDGTLPEEKFNVYFQQDHLFLRVWIALMCGGVTKAPDFASARPWRHSYTGHWKVRRGCSSSSSAIRACRGREWGTSNICLRPSLTAVFCEV